MALAQRISVRLNSPFAAVVLDEAGRIFNATKGSFEALPATGIPTADHLIRPHPWTTAGPASAISYVEIPDAAWRPFGVVLPWLVDGDGAPLGTPDAAQYGIDILPPAEIRMFAAR